MSRQPGAEGTASRTRSQVVDAGTGPHGRRRGTTPVTLGSRTSAPASNPYPARERILRFLAANGGEVHCDDGRGLTQAVAAAAGYQDLSPLNSMLARLENEGLITREVRGRRTYRLSLSAGGRKLLSGERRTPPGGDDDQPVATAHEELCQPKEHLRLYLLLLLVERPSHGYELIRRLETFGYERENASRVYRALHSLERAGLLRTAWATPKPGPARRMFEITPQGRRVAGLCGAVLRQRMHNTQPYLEFAQTSASDKASERERVFEVMAETKLWVHAVDQEAARRAVEQALAMEQAIGGGVRGAGKVWVYDATDISGWS